MLGQSRSSRRTQHCSPTEGDHTALGSKGLGNSLLLTTPEFRLAEGHEDVRDGHCGRSFDEEVGIDERHTELLCDPAADGRLTGSRRTDEHERRTRGVGGFVGTLPLHHHRIVMLSR